MIIYVPNKLIYAKDGVLLNHKKSNEVTIDMKDEDLKRLIYRLVKLKESSLEREAYMLTDTEIRMVAAYIPGNCLEVKLNNLFEIFKYRANAELLGIIYDKWQDYYTNTESNTFIANWITDNKDMFAAVADEKIKEKYIEILKANNVVNDFAQYIKDKRRTQIKSLDEILEPWEFRKAGRLYYKLKYLFYTYCSKSDYLEVSEEELLHFAKQYAQSANTDFKKFLINFVSEMRLSDLSKFSKLGKYMSSITEVPGTKTFDEFMLSIPQAVITRYVDWINRITIDEVFGYDERSMFWRNYRIKAVKKYSNSNSVAIDFGDYYVVEFLGRAMGAMYFYGKEAFEKKVSGWMKYRNNNDLRKKLNENEDLWLRKEMHSKPFGNEYYWQEQISWFLEYNKMASLIEE